jgi:serine phosphatase RsbU (regulator of sigma subunit)/PAS domain-containing protein
MDEGPDTREFRASQGAVGREAVQLDINRVYRAFSGVGVGLWDWDVASGRVLVDRAATRLLGLGPDPGPVTMDDLAARVHPDERSMVLRARDLALSNRSTFLEVYRVVHPDGSMTWVQTRAGVLVDAADGTLRIIGFTTERTSARTVRERAARALDHLGDLVLLLDDSDMIVYANIEAMRHFGSVHQDDLVGRAAAAVLPPGIRRHIADLRERRLASAARGEPGPPAALDIEETDAAGDWWGFRIFTIPDGLVIAMRNVNARHRADAERAELIGSLSSALRRSRQFLDVTVELGQALTVEELCDVAARTSAVNLGAFFTGVVLMEDGEPPRVLTRPHSDFLTQAWARMPDFGPAVTPQLLRTRRPRFDQSRLSYLRDFPDRAPNLDAMSLDAMASLPLIVSGRPIGVMLLGWPTPHTFDQDERRFMLTLVGPLAQALERARLYERQMSNVEELQRAVLPRTLPDVDGVRLDARYLPAGRDVGLGGDWYDATVLPDGTVSLVVGDVGGHGLLAVSTMAELRHAARAYALQAQRPADITTQLSAILADRADETLATAVVAHLDPVARELTWSCAGHPPPLLLTTVEEAGDDEAGAAGAVFDGAFARYLEEVHGPLLGVDATTTYAQSRLRLPPGSRLLLYSDGLVERRGRSLTDQLAMLADAAVAALRAQQSPTNLCDHILDAVAPQEREDDLCLLVVALR